MNAKIARLSIAITVMILFTLSLTLEPANGMARRRARDKNPDKITVEGTHEGPGGRIFRTRTEGERTEGGFLRQRTLTGPEGQTATGETRGWWDPETKTWRRQGTSTGPGGETAESESKGWWDPETKTWRRAGTRTGTRGVTTSESDVRRTEEGALRNTTTTGPGGEVVQGESRGWWDPETKTWRSIRSVTGPDGQVRTGTSESERLEDGSGRRITTTGAGGETVEREVRWSYDEETGTWKREVTATGADGESHTGTSEFNATTGGGSGE